MIFFLRVGIYFIQDVFPLIVHQIDKIINMNWWYYEDCNNWICHKKWFREDFQIDFQSFVIFFWSFEAREWTTRKNENRFSNEVVDLIRTYTKYIWLVSCKLIEINIDFDIDFDIDLQFWFEYDDQYAIHLFRKNESACHFVGNVKIWHEMVEDDDSKRVWKKEEVETRSLPHWELMILEYCSDILLVDHQIYSIITFWSISKSIYWKTKRKTKEKIVFWWWMSGWNTIKMIRFDVVVQFDFWSFAFTPRCQSSYLHYSI